ncbi:LysR substrate-binding domain-containing protein [Cupriavidus basilensis]
MRSAWNLRRSGKATLAAATAGARQLLSGPRFKASQEASSLSVSLLPTLGVLWLMQRLGTFMTEYPSIRLQVSSSLEPVDFKRENFDVALRVGQVPGAVYPEGGSQIVFRMTESWANVTAMHLWDDFHYASLQSAISRGARTSLGGNRALRGSL